jgi:hypothetical protein
VSASARAGIDLSVDLVGPAGVVAQAYRAPRANPGGVWRNRLARIQALEFDQFVGVLPDLICESQQHVAALAGANLPPGALEGCAGGANRSLDIRRVTLGDPGDELLGGRIHRIEVSARGGRYAPAMDQQILRLDCSLGKVRIRS